MAAIAVSWGSKVPTRCSGDTWGELARAGLSITVFAVGMIVGAPLAGPRERFVLTAGHTDSPGRDSQTRALFDAQRAFLLAEYPG